MKTKQLIAAILVAMTALTFAACGEKKMNDTQQMEESAPVLGEESQQTLETEEGESTAAPEATPEAGKQEKPQNDQTTGKKPEVQPTAKPEATPETSTAPTQKPEEQKKTVGQTLLADFKAKAGATSDALSLAEKLIANPIIPFSGATMPVEPGLLSGFGNTEIKGFKEGATFGPMIGSVPFIGYVFVLEDGASASDFIATLKKNADLRWNICVEAEEMVTGSAGNKVFFVMCPKEFTQE